MISNSYLAIGIIIVFFRIVILFTLKSHLNITQYIKQTKRDGYKFGNNPFYDRLLIFYAPFMIVSLLFTITQIFWLFYTGIHCGEIGFFVLLAMFLTNIFNKKTDFYIQNKYKIVLTQNIINIIGIIIILYQYAQFR